MKIRKKTVAYLKNEEIKEYTLTNSNNLSIAVLSYGGIIREIIMPDRKGKLEDITVHLDSVEEMIQDRPYHGAIIGPVAGRISNGSYFDGHKRIQLEQNEEDRTLHGGSHGLDTKNWKVRVIKKQKAITLILETFLPDLESGFPGNVEVKVSYTLNENNELKITYHAISDKRTIFSPTNHVYFNLSGNNKEAIYDHSLELASDFYVPITKEGLARGELKTVKNSDYDFRKMKSLDFLLKSKEKEIIEHQGIDHPFLLKNKESQPHARIYHEASGRLVSMTSDADAVVVYTHNHEQISERKNIQMHSGITLETSGLADGMNYENFPSILLGKDELFQSETSFQFSLIN